MVNNKLILRSVTSPWVSPFNDITKGSVLSWGDVDNNFIYLKGEVIHSAYTNNNELILQKINGNTISLNINGSTGSTNSDVFVTGGTLSLGSLILDRNDNVSIIVTGFTDTDNYVTGGTYNSLTESIDFIGTNSETTFNVDVSGLLDDTNTFTTGATLSGDTIIFDRNDLPNAYSINLSTLVSGEWTGGTQYIIVKAEGNDVENAQELQAAYTLATTMSPSATNRITIVAAPGNYNFETSNFIMNTQFVDLVSLDGNRSIIFNSSNSSGTISIQSNNTFVRGVNVLTKSFKISSGLNLLRVENCQGGDNSFGYVDNGQTFTLSSTFIDCVAGNNSFGHRPNIGGNSQINLNINGTFTNCTAGNNSFGYNTNNQVGSPTTLTFNNAKLTNCKAGNNSFGAHVSPRTGSLLAFNFSEFIDCESGVESFGYTNAGGTIQSTLNLTVFENCVAGDDSFGSCENEFRIFKNCQGGFNSFGSDGTVGGVFTNCLGGFNSFGTGGKLYRCQLTFGEFQAPTGSGIIVLGIDGNDAVINLTA
jgi:hypothetical protein